MAVHDWTRVDAGVFHDFHTAWLVFLRNALNEGVLPEGYYALAEQSAGAIGPDVLTLERRTKEAPSNGMSGMGKALATAPPKVQHVFRRAQAFYQQKQRRLAIRHHSEDRLVAIVEIVSSGNKSSRAAWRRFTEKAIDIILQNGIQLLIVDLYPSTSRDPHGVHGAVWTELGEQLAEPPDKPLQAVSYAVADDVTAYVEFIAVGDRLPLMPLFLAPDEYVDVPLDRTYDQAWQGVPKHLQRILTV